MNLEAALREEVSEPGNDLSDMHQGAVEAYPGSLTSPVDRVRSFVKVNREHGVTGIMSYEFLPLEVLDSLTSPVDDLCETPDCPCDDPTLCGAEDPT